MKKDHKVEVSVGGERYVAVELNGKVTISRSGKVLGHASWGDDQLLDSTAILDDKVVEELEKAIKKRADNNWYED